MKEDSCWVDLTKVHGLRLSFRLKEELSGDDELAKKSANRSSIMHARC